MHDGVGFGLIPRDHDVLHTWFAEAGVRLFILEIQIIDEKPLKPSALVDYYNNTCKSGFKFKIRVSIKWYLSLSKPPFIKGYLLNAQKNKLSRSFSPEKLIFPGIPPT